MKSTIKILLLSLMTLSIVVFSGELSNHFTAVYNYCVAYMASNAQMPNGF